MTFTETSLPAVEMTTAEFLALPRCDSSSSRSECPFKVYDDLIDEWVMFGDPLFPACIITLYDDTP